jgi:hypothetical protein
MGLFSGKLDADALQKLSINPTPTQQELDWFNSIDW